MIEEENLRIQQQHALAAEREQQRLQREREAGEGRAMQGAEAQCRLVWDALARRAEAARQAEGRLMAAEDAAAAHSREQVLQARRQLQAFQALCAEEDVEYDLPVEDDDEEEVEGEEGAFGDGSYIRDITGEEEPEAAVAAAAGGAGSTQGEGAQLVPTPPSVPKHSASQVHVTSSAATATNATAAGLRPAPTRVTRPAGPTGAGAGAAASVDPAGGKRWGGSVLSLAPPPPSSSASSSSASSSSSSIATASAVTHTSSSFSAASSMEQDQGQGGQADSSSSSSSQLPHAPRTLTLSASEQRAAADWRSALVASARAKFRAGAPFDEGSRARAAAAVQDLFVFDQQQQQQQEQHLSQDCGEIHPSLVLAMRCWQNWWDSQQGTRQLKLSAFKERSRSQDRVKSKTPSSQAQSGETTRTKLNQLERENEEALSNTMVDLETNPLFATELDFCVEGLCNTAFLAKFKNLTKLTLNVNKITDLSGIQQLSSLTSLSAKDNKIVSLIPLAGLTQLKYLYLDSNKISDLTPLEGLDQLRILSLNSNAVAEMPLLRCDALQRLELSHNKLCSLEAADCLLGVPVLLHLDLSNNQLQQVSGAALSSCGLLQTLILTENRLTQVPAPLLLPFLRNLRLNLNRIADFAPWQKRDDKHSIAWPLFLPSLQKLVLGDNQLSGKLPGAVFEAMPLLSELDLSFNSLADQEDLLPVFAHCRQLSALLIQDNRFTTTPVNTGGAAGTSRTALSEAQQAQLNQWLFGACPSLRSISATWFAPTPPSPPAPQQASTFHLDPMAQRQLLHFLSAAQQEQNVAAVKERAVKKDELAAKKGKAPASSSGAQRINGAAAGGGGGRGAVESEARDWEAELLVMLRAQQAQLVGFLRHREARPVQHEELYVFTSYAKDSLDSTDFFSASAVVPAFVLDSTALSSVPASVASVAAEEVINSGGGGGGGGVAAVRIQSAFRGHRIRKRLGQRLKTLRYADAELDSLLDLDLDLDFGLDFGADSDDFGGGAGASAAATAAVPRGDGGAGYGAVRTGGLAGIAVAGSDPLEDLEESAQAAGSGGGDGAPMVYGDHIRRRSRSSRENSAGAGAGVGAKAAGGGGGGGEVTYQQWILPADSRGSGGGGGGTHADNVHGSGYSSYSYGGAMDQDLHLRQQQQQQQQSRPTTGMSTASSLSAASAASALTEGGQHTQYAQHQRQRQQQQDEDEYYAAAAAVAAAKNGGKIGGAGGYGYGGGDASVSVSGGGGHLTDRSRASHSTRSAAAATLAQEWGISDPKVLAAMMKRNQRYK
jgi:Leucine-rich repeat (LRR) protein